MQVRIAITLAAIALLAGCAARHRSPGCNYRPIPTSPGQAVVISEKSPDDGVVSGFKSHFTHLPLDGQTDRLSRKLLIEECICLAAEKDVKANLLERERQALTHQDSEICPRALDIALAAQSIEQRNESAGTAATLFLKLVEIKLQLELLDEADQQLERFQETMRAAAEQGLATDEGRREISKRNIELSSTRSQLESSRSRINYQLSLLIGFDPQHDMVHPVYQLEPEDWDSHLAEEVKTGLNHRAKLLAFDRIGQGSADQGVLSNLLSQFDSRLGLSLPARVARKKILHQLRRAEQPGPGDAERRDQFAAMRDAMQTSVESEIADALFQAEAAHLELQKSALNIQRLERLSLQAEASRLLDARKAYFEKQRTMADLKMTQADRISSAIQLETAKIKLLQAQGLLAESCGYQLAGECSCPTN